MTRNIHGATVPAKFLTCPAGCEHCTTHPGHQAVAYDLGFRYGQTVTFIDPAAEVADLTARLRTIDRLTEPFMTGERDALAARAGVTA